MDKNFVAAKRGDLLDSVAGNGVEVSGQFKPYLNLLMTKESYLLQYCLDTVVIPSCIWRSHTGRVMLELSLHNEVSYGGLLDSSGCKADRKDEI